MKRLFFIFPVLFLSFWHITLLTQLKFTPWPEMLTYPWLMENGFRLYGDIVHPYPPLLPQLLFWFYKVFGFNIFSLKLITYLYIFISDILIFLIALKSAGKFNAYIILIFYFALQIFFEGNGLWFELASLPFILASFYLIVFKQSKQMLWLALSGAFLGFAILTKQTNIVFLAINALWLKKSSSRYALILSAVLVVFLGSLPFILQTPKPYFYWAFWHPLFVHARLPGFALWPTLKQSMFVFLISIPVIFYRGKLPLGKWFLGSLLISIPRFALFHLQIAAAFSALSMAAFFTKRRWSHRLLLSSYLGIWIIFLGFFIKQDFRKTDRFFELDVISVRNLLNAGFEYPKEVYFYNTPSQYFVFLKLLPIKPWADTFPWYLEVPLLQQAILEKLATLEYVVYTEPLDGKEFDLGVYKPELLTKYINENYTLDKQLTDRISIRKRIK